MTLVIPPGYAQISHRIQLTGDPEPMICGYGVDIASTAEADVLTMLNALHDAFVNRFAGLIANVYTITGAEARWLADPGDPLRVAFYPETDACTEATGPLPQNCAVLIHKRTVFSGRRARGRMFIPGIAKGQVSSIGGIVGAYLATYQSAATGFLSDVAVTANVGQMELLHSTSVHSATPDPYPVATVAVDPIISTQRKRLRR